MNKFCLDTECFDTCFWISTFIIPIITFILIRFFRPKLRIDSLTINQKQNLKVSIHNKSRFIDVNNLRVEVCILDPKTKYTYHFYTDHSDFLILPAKGIFNKKDNEKVFVCRNASQSAFTALREDENNDNLTQEQAFLIMMGKINSGYKIRVRCHAYDSFSGLGKSFEKIFS
jgi:hypothetical protein